MGRENGLKYLFASRDPVALAAPRPLIRTLPLTHCPSPCVTWQVFFNTFFGVWTAATFGDTQRQRFIDDTRRAVAIVTGKAPGEPAAAGFLTGLSPNRLFWGPPCRSCVASVYKPVLAGFMA